MKKLLIFTGVLLSTITFGNAFASAVISKTFDGNVAVCNSKTNVGERGYRLKLVSETETDTTKEVVMILELLKCSETATGFEFTSSTLNELTEKYYVDPNGKLKQIKTKIDSIIFSGFNQNAKNVGEGKIENNEKNGLVVRLSIANKTDKQVFILCAVVESIPDMPNLEPVEAMVGGFVLNF